VSGLLFDGLHALRLYRRYWRQSLMAVLVIAFSSGFAVASFSLYSNLTLTTPSGLSEPNRLASLHVEGRSGSAISHRLSESLLEGLRTIEAYSSLSFSPDVELHFDERRMASDLALVDEGYFELLGLHAAEGQFPDSADMRAEASPVVVISTAFWAEHLNRDPGIIGETLQVSGQALRIVAVMDPAFQGFFHDQAVDLWIPRRPYQKQIQDQPDQLLDLSPITPIVRLRDDTALDALNAELPDVLRTLSRELRDDIAKQAPFASQGFFLAPERNRAAANQLALFLSLSVLLALVAAVNISLFFLARAPAREREMAIRLAHGATPRRLMRQLFLESLLLVAIGSVLGLLAGMWMRLGLAHFLSLELTFSLEAFSWPMAAFQFLMVLALAAAVSLAPIVDLRRRSIAEKSRPGTARIAYSQHFLASAQILTAGLVLSLAIHFAASFVLILTAGPGYTLDKIQVLEIEPADRGSFTPDIDETPNLHATIREQLEAIPSVEAVGFMSTPPAHTPPVTHPFMPENGVRDEVPTTPLLASSDFLRVLDVPILSGQLPDADAAYAAVVNRRFAEQAWGHVDVLGEWFSPPQRFAGGEPIEVVAVIEDFHYQHPSEPVRPIVVVNRPHIMAFMADVLIRGEIGSEEAKSRVASALANFDPPLKVVEAYDLQAVYGALLREDRARAGLASASAGLILLMVVIGYLGTLRFMVERGRFEFAVRAAMGRGPRKLRKDVLRRACYLALPGMVLLLPVALMALSQAESLLGPTPLPLMLSLSLAWLVLGLLLAWAASGPAATIAKMDPAAALREE